MNRRTLLGFAAASLIVGCESAFAKSAFVEPVLIFEGKALLINERPVVVDDVKDVRKLLVKFNNERDVYEVTLLVYRRSVRVVDNEVYWYWYDGPLQIQAV